MSTRIEELEQQIKHHNDLYWNNKDLEISDIEYDNLCRELQELDPENELIQNFGKAETTESENLIKHSKPMLSLDKIYKAEDLFAWVKKNARTSNEVYLIQPKFDGMSGLLENGKLSSRGDGIYGQDYTDKLKMLSFDSTRQNIDMNKDTVLGEIIIRNSDFKNIYPNIKSKSGIPFKNQRNGIAGILGTDDTNWYASQGAKITLVEYDNNYSYEVLASEFESKWQEIVDKILAEVDYPMDGIVIKIKDKDYAESLGYTSHHPKSQVAYKFTNQKATSKLLSIEWSMGKQQISAIGHIEPVEISGVTIQKVKLQLTKPVSTDVDTCLIDGSLQIGDTVIVERAGDVIPHIVSSTPGTSRIRVTLDKCPFCGGEIEICDTSIICCNPDCKENLVQNLWYSINTLGFKNIGGAYIRSIVNDSDLNVKSIADLLDLKLEDLWKGEYGSKMKEIFINECKKAKENCDKATVLASLNIPNLGVKVSKLLVDNFDWEDIINNRITEMQMIQVPGIGGTIANSVKVYLTIKQDILQRMNQMFVFKEVEQEDNSGKLTICFTGKMEHKRSEMEEIARQKGFIPMDHVDKTLNILVCADPNSGSGKLQKAAKYGTKIISEEAFMNGTF